MEDILITLLVIPRETVYFSSMGKSNRNLMRTDWCIYPKHFLLAYMLAKTGFGNNISVSATSLVEFGKTCDDQTVSIDKGREPCHISNQSMYFTKFVWLLLASI